MKTFPDPNQKLDYKNIQKIVYVDCVLKKVMHIMPPVGATSKILQKLFN